MTCALYHVVGMALIFVRHAWVFAGYPAVMVLPTSLNIDVSSILRASALGTTFIFVLAGFFNHLPYERAYLRNTSSSRNTLHEAPAGATTTRPAGW